jgi:hypothetical protein
MTLLFIAIELIPARGDTRHGRQRQQSGVWLVGSALEPGLAREPPPCFPAVCERTLASQPLLKLRGLAAAALAETERREHRSGLNDG